MKFGIFIKRLFNNVIKFRGRYSLFYTYSNGVKYRYSIEHLIREDNDLLIYSETISRAKDNDKIIDAVEKKKILNALCEELTNLEYKFIIDSSIPYKP